MSKEIDAVDLAPEALQEEEVVLDSKQGWIVCAAAFVLLFGSSGQAYAIGYVADDIKCARMLKRIVHCRVYSEYYQLEVFVDALPSKVAFLGECPVCSLLSGLNLSVQAQRICTSSWR